MRGNHDNVQLANIFDYLVIVNTWNHIRYYPSGRHLLNIALIVR